MKKQEVNPYEVANRNKKKLALLDTLDAMAAELGHERPAGENAAMFIRNNVPRRQWVSLCEVASQRLGYEVIPPSQITINELADFIAKRPS